MTPHVKIKPIEIGPGTFGTEVHVSFGGQNYLTRLNYAMADTPATRALQAQLFLKRHNARVAEDHYNATLRKVDVTMSFDEVKKADRVIGITPTIKSHDDLIAFAKEGSPILNALPKQRPGLRLVK
ncbi:hypothetical protein IVB12_15640 [Bradyrhizobium sp. 179]|uniref:hypothetical protein n=1 Tax=Bradyrhizobium sp. 179 TaxID=2782648 RepID=UPI001FF875EE|nr:hypothetical protein [Bradyrhizobium sp. 179]MCK1543348.1 hypothetical protein [Bradyrhizobium sp. 179]